MQSKINIWQEWRGSNPQPPVLETGALPIELRTSDAFSYSKLHPPSDGYHGQGRNRTADTMIFSHVLYQLSYLAETKTPPEPIAARAGSVSRGKLTNASPLPPTFAGSTSGFLSREQISASAPPLGPTRGKRRHTAALQKL